MSFACFLCVGMIWDQEGGGDDQAISIFVQNNMVFANEPLCVFPDEARHPAYSGGNRGPYEKAQRHSNPQKI